MEPTISSREERPLSPPSGNPFVAQELSYSDDAESRLDKADAEHKLLLANSRTWCEARGRQVPPPPLSKHVEQLVKEWFQLVDDDNSGALDTNELEIALKAANIPCTQDSIKELLHIMDFNKNREIDWKEFHTFISHQVHAGQNLLVGELVLPSGLSLPLGLMIHALRRKLVMSEIFKGGNNRQQGVGRAQNYVTTMKDMVEGNEEHKAKAQPNLRVVRSKSSMQLHAPGQLEPLPPMPSTGPADAAAPVVMPLPPVAPSFKLKDNLPEQLRRPPMRCGSRRLVFRSQARLHPDDEAASFSSQLTSETRSVGFVAPGSHDLNDKEFASTSRCILPPLVQPRQAIPGSSTTKSATFCDKLTSAGWPSEHLDSTAGASLPRRSLTEDGRGSCRELAEADTFQLPAHSPDPHLHAPPAEPQNPNQASARNPGMPSSLNITEQELYTMDGKLARRHGVPAGSRRPLRRDQSCYAAISMRASTRGLVEADIESVHSKAANQADEPAPVQQPAEPQNVKPPAAKPCGVLTPPSEIVQELRTMDKQIVALRKGLAGCRQTKCRDQGCAAAIVTRALSDDAEIGRLAKSSNGNDNDDAGAERQSAGFQQPLAESCCREAGAAPAQLAPNRETDPGASPLPGFTSAPSHARPADLAAVTRRLKNGPSVQRSLLPPGRVPRAGSVAGAGEADVLTAPQRPTGKQSGSSRFPSVL